MARLQAGNFPMSPFRGGVNRNEATAGNDQAVDAMNVWCPGGDVERRPGFAAVATAAPHFLPLGRLRATSQGADLSFGNLQTDTSFPDAITVTFGATTLRSFYFGCDVKFSGVGLGGITLTGTSTSPTEGSEPTTGTEPHGLRCGASTKHRRCWEGGRSRSSGRSALSRGIRRASRDPGRSTM